MSFPLSKSLPLSYICDREFSKSGFDASNKRLMDSNKQIIDCRYAMLVTVIIKLQH